MVLLRQGLSPDRLALCAAIGVVVGNIPVLGVSTLICAAIAVAFRLNLAAIQIVQAAMAPTQILLMIPFVRLGEWLLRAPAQPLTIENALGLLLHAGLAWVLIAPPAIFLLSKLLIPVFERAAAQLKSGP